MSETTPLSTEQILTKNEYLARRANSLTKNLETATRVQETYGSFDEEEDFDGGSDGLLGDTGSRFSADNPSYVEDRLLETRAELAKLYAGSKDTIHEQALQENTDRKSH